MDQFLASVPKSLLAFLLIAGGTAFIILNSPPHTVCDSQLEVFKKAHQAFLFKAPKSKMQVTTKFERLRDHCKVTNNPGGCYELFQDLKVFVNDLASVSAECAESVGAIPEFKRALWDSADLLLRLAWGEKPPESYNQKLGWLEVPDVSLYCQVKDRLVRIYGESAWTGFREKVLVDLPGAKDIARNQVWDLSLLSENCARYP